MGLDFVSGQYGCLFSRCRKYVINSLIHGHFHIGLVIIPRLDSVSGQYGSLGMKTRPIWKCPCINLYLLYSYNFNPIKNTHLRHVTVHYFTRIVQPEAVFSPYWTSNTFFFRIVHYAREVTRRFVSSASKLFLIVSYNQINLFDI